MKGWIGVDLDGTLAEYNGWVGIEYIGQPIPAMLERVKRWREEGKYDVKIFTARVSNTRHPDFIRICQVIHEWLEDVGLGGMEITCQKDFGMVELWDDRCVQVIANTGEPVGHSTRGLS